MLLVVNSAIAHHPRSAGKETFRGQTPASELLLTLQMPQATVHSSLVAEA